MDNCKDPTQVLGIIGTIFGILGVLAALYFGLRSGRREEKKNHRADGQSLGTVQSDLGYIKGGIDDLKKEFRELRKDQGNLAERLAKNEESTRLAHKRIDELKQEN